MKTVKLPKFNGLTDIMQRGETVTISHAGNMGDSIKYSVKPNVDGMLGKGMFDKLEPLGIADGSADYLYQLKIPSEIFFKVVSQ